VPQSVRGDEREVENHAGGFVFPIDGWARLDRFLMLGTAGGTYYVGEREFTEENAKVVAACVREDGPRVVARVVEVSTAGRAAKQDYGLFALALAASIQVNPPPRQVLREQRGSVTVPVLAPRTPAEEARDADILARRVTSLATRAVAYAAMPLVCRTASTLFQFLSYVRGRRGWSRGLRSAVARWYNARPVGELAYQAVKYQERYGFTHRDLLRLGHPNPGDDPTRDTLYRWAVGKEIEVVPARIIGDFQAAKVHASDAEPEARKALARELPREALPTEWLTDATVQEALLYGGDDGRGMPLTALIRNLGNLSKCGLLSAGSDASRYVVDRLTDPAGLRAARVHPLALYLAKKVYGSGASVRGSGTWAPVGAVEDALMAAFEAAIPNVEPTGKAIVLGVDTSGSMGSPVLGYPDLSAAEVATVMAFVTMKTEPAARLLSFDTRVTEVQIAADTSLERFVTRLPNLGGGTDCALPMLWAQHVGAQPDAVVTFTDNETWAGDRRVSDALAALRRATSKPVKVVTAAVTATGYDVVDPADPLALGIAGFDASVPSIIADFVGDSSTHSSCC
jgi:60 kDa SS-A/Ro ribonucleoprotein